MLPGRWKLPYSDSDIRSDVPPIFLWFSTWKIRSRSDRISLQQTQDAQSPTEEPCAGNLHARFCEGPGGLTPGCYSMITFTIGAVTIALLAALVAYLDRRSSRKHHP